MPTHNLPPYPRFHNITLVLSLHLLSVFAGANLITSLRQQDVLLAGLVLATELVAFVVGFVILERMNPRVRYAWPPRSRSFIPDPDPSPCRELLNRLIAMVDSPTEEEKSQVRKLIGECEEESPNDLILPTAKSLLDSYGDKGGGQ